MKQRRRKIRLTYVASGESVVAEMLEDEAPNVCEFVWNQLPLETKAIHGMYSGLEVFAMIDKPEPVPAENLVQLPLPGSLRYSNNPGSGPAGPGKPVGEIVLVYGRAVVLQEHEACQRIALCLAEFPAIGNMIG